MPRASLIASTDRRRATGQRALSLLFAAVMALAPILANVWPAFGKGPMLYVGTPAAASAQQVDHAGHAGHEGHEAPAPGSHHQQHCALCVLALLGWAPPAGLSIGCLQAAVRDPVAWIALAAPRLQPIWQSAQARAPPLS